MDNPSKSFLISVIDSISSYYQQELELKKQ